MSGLSPNRGSAKRVTLQTRLNAVSWRRGLCFSALFLAAGWVILSFTSVRKEARASPSAFASREGQKGAGVAGVGDAGLLPAPWDPEGCQTVVFFHIPKTGGESLNNLWQVTAANRQRRLFGWAGYRLMGLRRTDLSLQHQEAYLTSIAPWKNKKPEMRHSVVELHCGNAISFMQARDALASMRADHEKNSCGFFAFTIVRPPLDWVVSLYNDICHRRLHGHKDTCPQKKGISPREEMLTYPHKDGMLSYLKHGWNGWSSPGPVDASVVEDTSKSLRSYLDIVAFTEEVPKLRRFLTTHFSAPGGVLSKEDENRLNKESVQNANPWKAVGISEFSPEEVQRLNATIQLDWKLYASLQEHRTPLSHDTT